MSYKSTFVSEQFADAVSAALKAQGWSVSAAALKKDGYLVNHIDDSELAEAVNVAKQAIAEEQTEGGSLADYDDALEAMR